MNFYEYLGVDQNASKDDIHKAFRKLAKQKHPDHNSKESAFWEMVELNVIRDTLLHDAKRLEYNQSLKDGTATGLNTSQSPFPSKGKKRHILYKSVKSFFTYRCKTCGLEMSSTWRGYCLKHYLEITGQIDNPDFIFEYGEQKYQWAEPTTGNDDTTHENRKEHPVQVKPWQIFVYTAFIVIISVYIVVIASQFLVIK
ncbi:MAG: DnaJ domain-containing protein [bacterium]|nr:DnaJ domain-containing protein [bacterium]